jgi:hypothetical protein
MECIVNAASSPASRAADSLRGYGERHKRVFVMPPRPITSIQPNVTVEFDTAKLATVAHLTTMPMTVIATWSAIDGIIAKMLANLIKSDLTIAAAMFQAIKSQDGQRQAVLAAAEKALNLRCRGRMF